MHFLTWLPSAGGLIAGIAAVMTVWVRGRAERRAFDAQADKNDAERQSIVDDAAVKATAILRDSIEVLERELERARADVAQLEKALRTALRQRRDLEGELDAVRRRVRDLEAQLRLAA